MTPTTHLGSAARTFAAVATAVVLLGGCAGTEQSPGRPADVAAGFPVTVDTAYGEITVPDDPERIVVVSTTYVDLLSYLGESPIAMSDDDESIQTYAPWLSDLDRGEVDPDLLDTDYLPSPEAIAAWEPDLILTDIWSVDEPLYAQLSQIAPTYVGIETDTNTSWQDNLGALARLTGHDVSVVDDVDASFQADLAAAASEVPGLTGATFQVAALGPDDQLWLTEYANAALVGLGLVPGAEQPTTAEQGRDAATYSRENVDQLTADVLFIATEHRDPDGAWRAALEADPRVAELPSSQDGTLVYLTGAQWAAVNGGSPTSIGWWLDQVVPTLAASALNQGS